jgi:hypothetical protein
MLWVRLTKPVTLYSDRLSFAGHDIIVPVSSGLQSAAAQHHRSISKFDGYRSLIVDEVHLSAYHFSRRETCKLQFVRQARYGCIALYSLGLSTNI